MTFDTRTVVSGLTPARSPEIWYPSQRRLRLAFAFVVLIGISTPSATSAPGEDALVASSEAALVAASVPAVSASVFEQPLAIMFFGAAMLTIAAMLRRGANSNRLHG